MKKENFLAISKYLILNDQPSGSDLIFIPGNHQLSIIEKAADIFHQGLAPKICISGGYYIKNEISGPTEYALIKNKALELGVPEEAIFGEDKASQTLENITFSKDVIEREIGWVNIHKVMVVCRNFHSRRISMYVDKYWPEHIQVLYITLDAEHEKYPTVRADNWWTFPETRDRVFAELQRIGEYARKGDL